MKIKKKKRVEMDKSKQSDSPSAMESKDEIFQDPRFAHLVNDPRFKQLTQKQKKVKIDKRFQSMFKDNKFKIKYTVDKYGRQVKQSSTEDLQKYYDRSGSDSDEESENELVKTDKNDEESHDKDEFGNDILEKVDHIPADFEVLLKDNELDYARGGLEMTDSSSGEESSEDENDELFIEHVWGELDRDAPCTNDSTNRLAACNLDWDRIRAVDLMVMCSSFLPKNGSILSVTIYPSEFGKERMAEEDMRGPQELRESKMGDDTELIKEDDDEEGSDYNMEKLRQYQLNRLKYYYAVIVCDSVATADVLYKECDGTEYESTATKLDLRFIPDDTNFDEDTPHDTCTEIPEMTKYKPRNFTTTALQQAKVELTWDETDMDRKELNDKLMSGNLNGVSDADLKKYVAYSSEDEEDGKQNSDTDKSINSEEESEEKSIDSISKYKQLLTEIKENEETKRKGQVEREYTWGIGVQEKTNSNSKTKSSQSELTPFEHIIEKKKAKQKARKEMRKAKIKELTSDKNDTDSDDDVPVGIDMDDPYFAEEFQDGQFAEPKSKKKLKKKLNNESDEEEKKNKAELSLLLEDDDDNAHFNLKKILENETESKSKSKKRLRKLKKQKKENDKEVKMREDNFTIDTSDQRFSAIYSSHLYNIDPSDPHFKKTKGMERIIDEKLKRRRDEEENPTSVVDGEASGTNLNIKKKKKDIAMNILVKSIKRKLEGM